MKTRIRKQKPEIRRRTILDAARAVLLQKGYHDFKMSDVAKKAKIGIGTLYLYFKDKVGIFTGVFIDLLDRLDERLEVSLHNKFGIEAVRQIGKANLEFLDEYQDFLFQFRANHPAVVNSKAGKELKSRFEQHLGVIGKHMRECISEKSVRPMDVSLLCVYLNFLGRMFMVHKKFSKSTKPLTANASELMEIFLHGVGAK